MLADRQRFRGQAIVAAPGWQAVYGAGEGEEPEVWAEPLVCWMLVEQASSSQHASAIVGVTLDDTGRATAVCELEHWPDGRHFLGYTEAFADEGRWMQDARDHIRTCSDLVRRAWERNG